MSRKSGDWICRACQYDNFCWRDSCQRCKKAKFGVDGSDLYNDGAGDGSSSSIGGGGEIWDVKPGDWYCSCGVRNYANRSCCFKCSASKDASASAVAQSWGSARSSHSGSQSQSHPAPAGWKSGDWICARKEYRSGCNRHNYASRTGCFWCNAPRN